MRPQRPNNRLIVLLVGICLLASVASAQTTNRFFQFIQEQSNRRYTQVPHHVLALWYGWFGNPGNDGWVRANGPAGESEMTVHHPLAPRYSSHDTAVIDSQIDQAKAHGVTGFVASWWGKGAKWEDDSLALLLERAEKKDFKVSVYWELNRDTGKFLVQFSVDDLTYVLGRYAKSKAFLKVDGKPVIFAYERVESQASLVDLMDIVESTRAKAGDFILIGHGYRSSLACFFDGLHTDYGHIPWRVLRNPTEENFAEFRQAAARYFGEGAQVSRQRSRIVCPMIIPGFDNGKSSPDPVRAERQNGGTYRVLWEEALKTNPDWVLVSSWNEWAEATEVEPSKETGNLYLELTAQYAQPFLKTPAVATPDCPKPPQHAPGTALPADRLLAGRQIGIIMEDLQVDAEFWSAYCGAETRRMRWTDLVEPRQFHATNCAVLLLAVNEHYRSSVKVTDDVTRSLIRYLHEGGFLVLLPFGPWPLLYDDNRKGVAYGITDRLALGIGSGFASPPERLALAFRAQTNLLFGLSEDARFPSGGDLRWVPANRRRVPASEIYVPLVQLRDNNGKAYGDAVAYIEHRMPSLAGGKTIYVWMRTPEAFGRDIFLPSLCQFISTRLKPLQRND